MIDDFSQDQSKVLDQKADKKLPLSERTQQDEEEELPTYISSPGSATYDSLRDFATKEPEQVARVLKTWMSS